MLSGKSLAGERGGAGRAVAVMGGIVRDGDKEVERPPHLREDRRQNAERYLPVDSDAVAQRDGYLQEAPSSNSWSEIEAFPVRDLAPE